MSNPIDKYLEKKAGLGDFLGKAKEPAFNTGIGALTMGGVAAGISGGAVGVQKLYQAITKKRDFRLMLEHNEDLRAHLENNPKFFNQAYSSLRSVNPQFGADPLIAGTYMRRMMESQLSAGGILAESGRDAQGGSPVMDATMRGALQGAYGGLSKQHNPHDQLEQDVHGLTLQKKHRDLTSPMAGMRQEIDERNTRHEYENPSGPPGGNPRPRRP